MNTPDKSTSTKRQSHASTSNSKCSDNPTSAPITSGQSKSTVKKTESMAFGISLTLHIALALSLGVSSFFDSTDNTEQEIDVVTLMEYRPASARSDNKPVAQKKQKIEEPQQPITPEDVVVKDKNHKEEPVSENFENENMVATGDSDIGSDLKGRAPRNATERYLAEIRDRILRLQTYPNASKALREEGLVKIRLTVDKKGSLVKIELIEASPYKRLNDAAMKAATRAAPFKPFPDEVTFDTWRITLPVQFTLAQN